MGPNGTLFFFLSAFLSMGVDLCVLVWIGATIEGRLLVAARKFSGEGVTICVHACVLVCVKVEVIRKQC